MRKTNVIFFSKLLKSPFVFQKKTIFKKIFNKNQPFIFTYKFHSEEGSESKTNESAQLS